VSANLSKCQSQGNRSNTKNIEEISAIINDNTKTDQEIAEIMGISRRTVLRARKALKLTKQRGGVREGAGRPMGSENINKYPPAEILPRAKLYINSKDFYGNWARSGFRKETGRKGMTQYTPLPGVPGKGWTYQPPLFQKQLF